MTSVEVLADRGSWTLSPAFDVNPSPDRWRARSTSIMGADPMPDEADAVLALAEDCGLGAERARERMGNVAQRWPAGATPHGATASARGRSR